MADTLTADQIQKLLQLLDYIKASNSLGPSDYVPIRRITASLIIEGTHQNFRFKNDPNAVFHLKNEFAITDLIPAIMDLKIGDVNHNAFTFRYIGNTDFAKNEFGLYVVKNSILDSVPVFKINQTTKEFTFLSKAYITKDDGTTALIGSGGGATQAQLDSVLQQAKDFTQKNRHYKYDATTPNPYSSSSTSSPSVWHQLEDHNLFQCWITGVPNQQGYIRAATFQIDVSTKEWSLSIDSLDTAPARFTDIVSGTKDTVNIHEKKLQGVLNAVNDNEAVNKGQLDAAISALNIPSGTLATQNWVTAQNYVVSSTLDNYVTSVDFNAYKNSQTSGSSSGTISDNCTFQSTNNNTTITYSATNQVMINFGAAVRTSIIGASLFKDQIFPSGDNTGWTHQYNYQSFNNYREYCITAGLGGDSYIRIINNAGAKRVQIDQPLLAPTPTSTSATTQVTTKAYVDGLISTGDIKLYPTPTGAGQSFPGWLRCEGGSFSATTYPTLAAILGGTTLPNLTSPNPAKFTYLIKT